MGHTRMIAGDAVSSVAGESIRILCYLGLSVCRSTEVSTRESAAPSEGYPIIAALGGLRLRPRPPSADPRVRTGAFSVQVVRCQLTGATDRRNEGRAATSEARVELDGD